MKGFVHIAFRPFICLLCYRIFSVLPPTESCTAPKRTWGRTEGAWLRLAGSVDVFEAEDSISERSGRIVQ